MIDIESFKTKVVELAIEKMDKEGSTLIHDGRLLHRETLKEAINPKFSDFISMMVRGIIDTIDPTPGYTFKTINAFCPEGIHAYPGIEEDSTISFLKTSLRKFDNISFREVTFPTSVVFIAAQFYSSIEIKENGFPNLEKPTQDINDIYGRLSEHYQPIWQKAHDLIERDKSTAEFLKGYIKRSTVLNTKFENIKFNTWDLGYGSAENSNSETIESFLKDNPQFDGISVLLGLQSELEKEGIENIGLIITKKKVLKSDNDFSSEKKMLIMEDSISIDSEENNESDFVEETTFKLHRLSSTVTPV